MWISKEEQESIGNMLITINDKLRQIELFAKRIETNTRAADAQTECDYAGKKCVSGQRVVSPFKVDRVAEKIMKLMEEEKINQAEAEEIPDALRRKLEQNSELQEKGRQFTVQEKNYNCDPTDIKIGEGELGQAIREFYQSASHDSGAEEQ